MNEKPSGQNREVAGKITDALMEMMRRQYIVAMEHAPGDENGLTEMDELMDSLATCDGLDTNRNTPEPEE